MIKLTSNLTDIDHLKQKIENLGLSKDIKICQKNDTDEDLDYVNMVIDLIESELEEGKPIQCISCCKTKCDLICEYLVPYQIFLKNKKHW